MFNTEYLCTPRFLTIFCFALYSNGKLFAQNIFGILASLKAREEGKHSTVPSTHTSVSQSSTAKSNQPPTYNRYEQESFKQKEGNENYFHQSIFREYVRASTHVYCI